MLAWIQASVPAAAALAESGARNPRWSMMGDWLTNSFRNNTPREELAADLGYVVIKNCKEFKYP